MMVNGDLNPYRIMWIFVLFDLPTYTAKQRKAYSIFHKELLKGGFTMMQYSIYKRWCGSRERLEMIQARVVRTLPPEGKISVLQMTDKQFGMIEHYVGYASQKKKAPELGDQLELF